MTILEALQTLPHVRVMLSDVNKTICCVRMAVERTERVDSGSMMFHHPRYLEFGQLVIFTAAEVVGDQAGALFFQVESGEEAVKIIENIEDHIPRTKEEPDSAIIIKQIT